MFSKPYKLKSNNTLKNSEKKHLVQRIQDEIPLATEAKAKELISVKSNTSCMKLVLHSGETVGVYVVEGMPMIIDVADELIPTVCALWKVPDLVPTLTMQSLVLDKVAGGAPLYVPGVVPALAGGSAASFAAGAVVAARTSDNAAAALVGRAALSSSDLLVRASGVCLETLHVYRDLLCKDPKFCRIERPELGLPIPYIPDALGPLAADIKQLSIHKPVKEEWPSLGKPKPFAVPKQNVPCLIPEVSPAEAASDHADDRVQLDDSTSTMDESQSPEDPVPADMEGLLRWCLLTLMKRRGKSLELPLKTNLLYKNHLMPLCPAGRTLDVKKSTYKKMGKFLEAMQQEGLLQVREIEKGVDAVVALHLSHPLVRSHTLSEPEPQPEPEPDADRREQYEPPQVREMYCVTAAVADLFAPYRKGSALTLAEIRATVTEYVRSRNLTSTQVKGSVVVEPLLAKILNKPEQEHVKWEGVMSGVVERMTAATEMRYSDGSVSVTKAKLEPVKMQVASRSGNKKVTLVSNLESFGFNLTSLAALCQVGVAASCGVTRSPGSKADQLMLQGDQTYFMAKLLIEKYGLPKKYVEGADKALKKKKCN